MTFVYIVLSKFRPEISDSHKATFVTELRKLKNLSCVKDGRPIVGGPSVTDLIERSKGFQFVLVSYHENLAALAEYQASSEHHWVTSTYMFPFKEDLCRFEFEVDPADEYICNFIEKSFTGGCVKAVDGVHTPPESNAESTRESWICKKAHSCNKRRISFVQHRCHILLRQRAADEYS